MNNKYIPIFKSFADQKTAYYGLSLLTQTLEYVMKNRFALDPSIDVAVLRDYVYRFTRSDRLSNLWAIDESKNNKTADIIDYYKCNFKDCNVYYTYRKILTYMSDLDLMLTTGSTHQKVVYTTYHKNHLYANQFNYVPLSPFSNHADVWWIKQDNNIFLIID